MIHRHRGATLIELTIVIAVLSILTVLTVTFSQLVRNQVLSIVSDNVIIEDWENTKNVFDSFVTSYDNDSYDFLTDGEKLYAVEKATGRRSALMLTEEGIFVGTIPVDSFGKNRVIYNGTRSIEKVKFTILDNQDTGNLLIEIEVTYVGYNSAGTKEISDIMRFFKATRVSGLYEE